MKNNIETFLFDFDGVLVNSTKIKSEAFAELFSQYGEEFSKKVRTHAQQHGGMSRFAKFKEYYGWLDKKLTKEILDKLSADFSKIVFNKVSIAPEIPGAITFLTRARRIGKVFIVSATPNIELSALLQYRGILKIIDGYYGSPPEKTEILQQMLIRESINPKKAVYFGDTASDFEAAKTTNLNFFAINYHDQLPKNVEYTKMYAPNFHLLTPASISASIQKYE